MHRSKELQREHTQGQRTASHFVHTVQQELQQEGKRKQNQWKPDSFKLHFKKTKRINSSIKKKSQKNKQIYIKSE